MKSTSLFKPSKTGAAKFITRAKLTPEDVSDILSKRRQKDKLEKYIAENLSVDAIAAEYGVSVWTIKNISAGRAWTHIA